MLDDRLDYGTTELGCSVATPRALTREVEGAFALSLTRAVRLEVLVDGCFNADPHPGNILFVDCGTFSPAKLGLIDYGQVKSPRHAPHHARPTATSASGRSEPLRGAAQLAAPHRGQVKRLSDQQRYDLAKSFLLVEAAIEVDPRTNPDVDRAVHERAKASLIRQQKSLGVVTKHSNPDVIYDQSTVYLGRMDAAWLYPMNAAPGVGAARRDPPRPERFAGALCPLPAALCPLPSALCPLPSARCPLPLPVHGTLASARSHRSHRIHLHRWSALLGGSSLPPLAP